MKRILVLLVVLAIALFAAMPAFADRGSGGQRDEDRSAQQDGPHDDHDSNGDSAGESSDDSNDDDAADDSGDDSSDDSGDDSPGDRQEDRQQDRQQDRQEDRQQDRQQDQQQDRQQDRTSAADGSKFDVTGMILGVDRSTGLVTLAMMKADQPDGAVQERLMVQALAQTKLQMRVGSAWATASMSDLQPGQTILVRGTISGDTWTASRIRVGKKL